MIAAFVLVLLLASMIVGAWLVLLLASQPAEAIRSVRRREFFGPGGPDDPFADEYHEAWLRRRQARAGQQAPSPNGDVPAQRSPADRTAA